MGHDVWLAVILYICGCFYLGFGLYAIFTNRKSLTNRLFLYLTISMAVWAFTFSIVVSSPTEEVAFFWQTLSVTGWGVFYSFLFHFILILTKFKSSFKYKKTIISLIYLPSAINIVLFGPLGPLKNQMYQMIPSKFGWVNITPNFWANVWISVYYLTFTIASIVLIIIWIRKLEPQTLLKRRATHFLISVITAFVIGTSLDIIPDALGIGFVPRIAIIFLIPPILILFLLLKNSGLLFGKNKTVVIFPQSDADINKDRLRLFQTTALVFMIGGAATFLVGYFGIKKSLEYELLLSSLLFLSGVFLMLLPRVVKKHFLQNTLFLIVSSLCMLFLMITNDDTAATTLWAAYIIFFLITVVLGSKIHALIFMALVIGVEIYFWITIPEVSVIVDGNQHITRILIILLSYYAVRHLTNEYASKLSGYQRFAKEQETLERISTNFISVSSENSHEKINEMFKIASEVLDYDQGYLIKFSDNLEEATFLNAHVKDGVVESLPYSLNTTVKTEDFLLAKTIVAQKQPMGCANVSNMTDDEKEIKDFFESRGILSYYALPVTLDDKMIGILVVEDYKKANLRTRENQIYFLGVVANILADTRRKLVYEKQLYDYAYFDQITKLGNRNMLIKKLNQKINDCKELDKLAVLYIEIENLRMINDTFGHTIGDKVVVKSAAILKNLMKDYCCISKTENGAFVVVIPNIENIEQIENRAEQIINAFSAPIIPSEGVGTLFVSTAIGISMYPDDGKDAETLLQNADLATYAAKNSDDKVVFCSEQLKNRIAENTLLTNRIFTALENGEFSLEFQPQINSKTGKTAGVEALLRWNFEENKRIRPDIFIPILEQTGLIHDVGLWVLEQSLKEHKRLVKKGFPPLRFSVNLSIVQVKEADFVIETINLIEKSKVDPKYIELEITESFLSTNFADTITKLNKLKEYGISIAIDDFGKGYSSLHRLELVPFDRIKIDKSIVDDIIFENKKIVIVETIVSLAKALRADTTAEGVETKEQLDFLKNMDCDEIQGYYYSKPLPIKALEEFLKNE